MKLPVIVSDDFPDIILAMYPADLRSGAIGLANHGDGKGIFLTKWPDNLPMPTADDAVNAIKDKSSASRKAAYERESDALVIRAVRLQLAGDPGFDAAKAEALAKVSEIKARYPDKGK